MPERTCDVPGCDRPHRSKGFCASHYNRWRKTGDPGSAAVRQWGRAACNVDGCERQHYGRGYCHMHFERVRTKGAVELALREPKKCRFDGCGHAAKSLGLCNGHVIQTRRGKELTPLEPRRSSTVRDEHGRKLCGICGAWKGETEFYPNKRHVDSLSTYCKRCDRGERIQRRYGITLDEYEAMADAQGGGCAICGAAPKEGASLHIDHDHACCSGQKESCGRCVRGLLCEDCNRVLGTFRDDVSRFESAIIYLKNSAAWHD